MNGWKWVLQLCDFVNFYLIRFDINVVIWKITLVPQYDILQRRRCAFSIVGSNQSLLGGRPIFCMENLVFHLKKGYSVNYWRTCSLYAHSVPTALYYSTQSHGWFSSKNFTENKVLLIVLSVMLSTNFPISTFIWCWLILLWFKNNIRERYLTERQGFKLCWDVIFEWFYWKWVSDDFVW